MWPADNIKKSRVDDLVPYARNARTHSDAQVAQIAASIKEWGWTTPVLLDENNGIIAGHGRVLAARKLGISEIPTMIATGWSEAQKRAYILADNQLALNAGWDTDLLKVELSELEALDFDVDLIGFDGDVLAQLLFNGEFSPGDESQQGSLDNVGKDAQCPNCGEVFDPVVNSVDRHA